MFENPHVVRLRLDGGNLVATIPQALARELALAPRDYVRIFRSGPLTLTLTPAEVRRRVTPDVSIAPD